MATTSMTNETLDLPLEGLTEAEIRIGFGGGELTIGKAHPATLIAGTFEGGVIQKSSGPGRIALEPSQPGRVLLTWAPTHWDVRVTGEIPVDLRLDTGANRSSVDLTALQIRRLELHTGASETTIRLPATGETAVRIDCGFATVFAEVPEGVAARIRGKMGLGAIEVDEIRFPRGVDGWTSADFDTASNRVDISIEGGFGTVRIR